MPDFTPAQRADPAEAGSVFDSLLRYDSGNARRACLDFLARSIEWAAQENKDRWGVTLFRRLVRLNAGWVQCFVVSQGEIHVLVEAASIPVGFHLEGRTYGRVPGYEMTTLALSDSARAFAALAECHRAAIVTSARFQTTSSIRSAHSPGIIRWLSGQLGRPLPDPSYSEEYRAKLGHLVEGGRKSYVLSRYEYDPRNRAKCLDHYGHACAVCGMTFEQRYGTGWKDCIEVHHLTPLAVVGKEHEVPVEDLRPVCPNCHTVIHGGPGLLSIQQAKALLNQADDEV